jgi:2,4'-dihydroxyacetophenone dioxygenase
LDVKALTDLAVNTLHAEFEDFPWVVSADRMEMRVVHARKREKMMVVQFRAYPGARSGLHRHLGPVLGLTTKGAWSHDPKAFLYKPNSYICEPNELHRFYNGPDITEAFYITHGDTEWFDDEGREVINRTRARPPLLSGICRVVKN